MPNKRSSFKRTVEESSKRITRALYTILEEEGSQMPSRVIFGAHEWINEIPTVPIYYLANPQPRERAWQNQRGKKTLLSFTLV